MRLNKVVIGIRFNKKSFKLSSLSGIVVDDVLELRETNRKLGPNYLSQFKSSLEHHNLYLKFMDADNFHTLTITPERFLFTKKSPNDTASVNIDTVIEEFEILWKTVSKTLKFPDIRMIGIVGEYHIGLKKDEIAGDKLTKSLLKFDGINQTKHFNLQFENREMDNKGLFPDGDTSDFWNTIYSYYPSEIDVDYPTENKINANIDVQKYYNPAKSDPVRELRLLKSKFSKKKEEFKAMNHKLGIE
ncbi:hypothetical protein KW543_18455 [Vibrio fluvialis]|nr:hypothetical protein [Vibrio fluvialis]